MTRVAVAKPRAAVPGQLGALAPVRLSEKDFQRQVTDLARRLGWDLVFHAMQPFHAVERGWPDLVLVRVRDRRLIFAELKAEKGKLSERQVEVLKILRAVSDDSAVTVPVRDGRGRVVIARKRSIEVHVWRPSDYDRVVEVLR